MKMHIYIPGQSMPNVVQVDLKDGPGLDALRKVIMPHLKGAEWMEHVAVEYNSKRRDMFVDETGALKGLPINEAATKIYQTYWLRTHPGTIPNSISQIYGVAVLFPDNEVWT